MAGYVQNVNTFSDAGADQAALARRQKMAEALMQQGMDPLQTNQMAGGYVVPVSPWAGLAKVAQSGVGGWMQGQNDEKQKELAHRRNTAMADALSSMPQARTENADTMTGRMDDEGSLYPPALRTTTPALADYAQWLGRLGQIGPDAVSMGTGLLGMQQKANEGEENRTARLQERIMALDAAATNQAASREDRAARAKEAADLRREIQASQQTFAAEQARANQAFQAQQAREARAARPEPQRQLQLTTDENGNTLIVNPDRTTSPLVTSDGQGVKKPTKADRPMTEFQGKSAGYGTRSAQADKILTELEEGNSGLGMSAMQKMGIAGNMLMDSNHQSVDQAQRNFVNAVLRQESGAAIAQSEFDNAKKQYFAQPGDSKEVIAQKRQNRQTVIDNFARSAGPRGEQDIRSVQRDSGVSGTTVTAGGKTYAFPTAEAAAAFKKEAGIP